MIANITDIDQSLAYALEESEAAYWGKYYHPKAPLASYSTVIAGAFAGALPELDVLAMNRVIGLGLRISVQERHLDDIIRFYDEVGSKRFFIQLSPYANPENLAKILQEKGFQYHNNWAKLLRKVDLLLPETDSELTVEEIGRERSGDFAKIIFESFDWPDERLMDWLAFSVRRSGYRHYLAFYKNKPVAAAALHAMGMYASMAFAATLPEYRGMGAQSLLLKTRIEAARDMGCHYLISETAENKDNRPVTSFRNMQRFGFQTAYLRQNWIWEF